MAQFGRGIKAGLLTAMVFLVIAAVFELTGISSQYRDITMAAGLDLGREPWRTIFETMLLQVIIRVAAGTLFGVVFAALYDHLPGVISVVKGVMVAAFLWIIGAVGLTYTYLERLIHGMPPGPWYGPVPLPSVGQVLVSFASALAFGALVGLIWGRLGAKEVVEVRRGMAALLVGWILGILVWAYAAALFGAGWGIGRLFPAGSGLGWFALLVSLSTFIGAVGWIFALLAWRRTRRGESGFRLGLAGGVIMAVTGIMLLPGVLSIIGGVLSRREPASEVSPATQ